MAAIGTTSSRARFGLAAFFGKAGISKTDEQLLVAPIYWKYTATLELWERPLAPAPWGNYPEWIVGSSLLDIALNKEWPKHDAD